MASIFFIKLNHNENVHIKDVVIRLWRLVGNTNFNTAELSQNTERKAKDKPKRNYKVKLEWTRIIERKKNRGVAELIEGKH